MINMDDFLELLAEQKPIFHSEEDFKHAFAWRLYQELPLASVRLELPMVLADKRIHVDICANHKNTSLFLN